MVTAEILNRSAPPAKGVVEDAPRPDECNAVFELFAGKDTSDFKFNEIIEHEALLARDRVVMPAIRKAWPSVDSDPFRKKLDACVMPYTNCALSCIMLSQKRPRSVRMASGLARFFGMSSGSMARSLAPFAPVLFRFLEKERVERAVLGATLIIVFDEALDDGMAEYPIRDRASVLCDVVRGTREPTSERMKATAEIAREMRARLKDDGDRQHFEHVVELFQLWAEAEVKNLMGEPDPSGFCHRREAMLASMEVLGWGVRPYVGDAELHWMIGLAECGQMIDDLLDMEKDAKQGRITPAREGRWNFQTIQAAFAEGEAQLEKLLRDSGEPDGPYLQMCLETFRGEAKESVRVLRDHP